MHAELGGHAEDKGLPSAIVRGGDVPTGAYVRAKHLIVGVTTDHHGRSHVGGSEIEGVDRDPVVDLAVQEMPVEVSEAYGEMFSETIEITRFETVGRRAHKLGFWEVELVEMLLG